MSEKREGDEDRSVRKQSHSINPESPEKVQPKRAKPDLGSSTSKAIDFAQPSSGIPVAHSIGDKLPLWVAGSSPAKFVALDDMIKINSHIEKMAIVHEIAVDPKFSVENLQQGDQLFTAVKRNMHKAYWDILRADLAKDPSDYDFAFQLLKDLKTVIHEQFSAGNLNNAMHIIDEILDLNHLRLRYEQRALDFRHVLRLVLQVLERLCAPIRDEIVTRLKAEEDLVNLFSGIFELVGLMETDMANFALSQNRGTIESYSAQIERDEFMKVLEIDPSGSQYTERWLHYILGKSSFVGAKATSLVAHAAVTGAIGALKSEASSSSDTIVPTTSEPSASASSTSASATASTAGSSPTKPERPTLSDVQIRDLIIDMYLTLIEMNPLAGGPPADADLRDHFPETLALDRGRLLALGEKHLQLELVVGALFVASNLAGRRVCDALPDFKPTLKNELVVILNDVSWSNHVEKLNNVYVQCEKNLKAVDSALLEWSDEKLALLRQQIMNLGEWNDSIRLIARARIRGFLHLVLRRDGEQIRLPPGLAVIQSELAALASKLYAILVHNWNAFGEFYADLLRRAHQSHSAD